MPIRLDRSATGLVAALLFAGSAVAQATGPSASQIAHTGVAAQGTRACASCHGQNGEGVPEQSAPRLAGMDAGYLAHELDAFRGGTRRNDTMQAVARGLTPDQVRLMADYYAGLPAQAASSPGDPKLVPLGREIAEQGDWPRGAPPCASCHGPGGLGVGASFPMIAGQSAGYIESQLLQFRSGARADDPLGLMRAVASHLTPSEFEAVAAYYASLPVRPAPAPATGDHP